LVLKGGVRGYSIPLDSPLYPTGTPIVYYGCRVLIALATVDGASVDPVLPEGVDVASSEPLTAFWIGYYPISNVGTYHEALIAVQVTSKELPLAYYIPYIYVTNDKALTSGRELLGAPKKLARIKLEWSDSGVRGALFRNSKLMEITMYPKEKVDVEGLRQLLPEEIPLLSIRVLPPLPGSKGLAQLIQWHAKIVLDQRVRALTGPIDLRLNGTSEDPLDRVRVRSVVSGFYLEFDMELHVDRVVKEWVLEV
jgi:acetoacetate decarboxylase